MTSPRTKPEVEAYLMCSWHGRIVGDVCEPCEVHRIAMQVLDRNIPDVPLKRSSKVLLAKYALLGLKEEK